jgi:hypothetical protein
MCLCCSLSRLTTSQGTQAYVRSLFTAIVLFLLFGSFSGQAYNGTRCLPYVPACEAPVAETLPEIRQDNVTFEMPKGASLHLSLLEPLSSETSIVGQPFEARIAETLYQTYNGLGLDSGKPILSPGDLVRGHVIRVEPAIQGRGGRLTLAVDELILDTGLTYDLDASVLYFQDKPFFGGEGTEGTTPVVFPYRIMNFPRNGDYKLNYNRYRLLGAKQPGEPFHLHPGDLLVVRLNSPLSVYRY